MSKQARLGIVTVLSLCLLTGAAWAGEPLVVKTEAGKYIPALASEWTKAGDKYRFVLKAGNKAPDIAAELADQIAPVKVEAADDLTLVFSGKDLVEKDLLEKLSAIELGKESDRKDALAALSAMGDEGGPALSDLSSAGSIRASKKIELPTAGERQKDPCNLVGKVLEVHPCEPLPTIEIKVIEVPSQGEHKAAFKKNKRIAIRGFYKIFDDSKKIDPSEARTKINLETAKLKRGAIVYGKPFLKEGKIWILETIEKK